MLETIGFLGAGGLTGVLGRYAINDLFLRFLGLAWPWATLIVNLTGCFLIGLFDAMIRRRGLGGPHARLLLMTGFCGGYTTFSALMFEFDALVRVAPSRAGAYLAASLVGGFFLLRAGLALGGR